MLQLQSSGAILYPQLCSMVNLKAHIEDLLKASDLNDVQKLHLLQQSQERYRNLKDNMQQAARTEIVIAGPAPDMGAQVAPAATVQASAASVTGPVVEFSSVTLPPQYTYRFAKFQDFVGCRPGLLDKCDKDEVGIEVKTIEG